MADMTVKTIIEQIQNLDKKVATFFIEKSYSDLRQKLLLGFLDGTIEEKEVIKEWDTVFYPENISDCIRLKDLDIYSRLCLMNLILDHLGLSLPEGSKKCINLEDISVEDCTLALAQLINDVFQKDKFRVRMADTKEHLDWMIRESLGLPTEEPVSPTLKESSAKDNQEIDMLDNTNLEDELAEIAQVF